MYQFYLKPTWVNDLLKRLYISIINYISKRGFDDFPVDQGKYRMKPQVLDKLTPSII